MPKSVPSFQVSFCLQKLSASALVLGALCLTFSARPVKAAEAIEPSQAQTTLLAGDFERLRVTDPYIELHTGPGRGFPVFFVVARDLWIEIELRHTDWYKVRTEDGKLGWVHRQQLQTTLTTTGRSKTFREVLLDDYLNRRLQLGGAWGQFKSEPMLKFWSGYRLSDTLSVEATLGQVQGVFSGTDFWHINVVSEPWSDQRISPFFGIGVGQFKNFPNLSLVGATPTDAKLTNASLGLNYHISARFVLRADYTIYTVFVADTHTAEYRAFAAGLSFFF